MKDKGLPARHIHLFTISKNKVALVLFWQTGREREREREREKERRERALVAVVADNRAEQTSRLTAAVSELRDWSDMHCGAISCPLACLLQAC